MSETDELSTRESSERPAARAPRHNQVSAWRDLYIRPAEHLTLQLYARLKLVYRHALAYLYLRSFVPSTGFRLR
jgi:hypothetical protein